MLILNLHSSSGQGYNVETKPAYLVSASTEPEEIFDELTLTLNVQRIGSVDIPAIISGQWAYLPVKDIFDFLKIKCTLSPDLDSAYGFIITPNAPYVIDKSKNRIYFGDRATRLKPDELIRTESNLFLRSDYFGKIFGLECKFDFRSLSVSLTTMLELPAIREMNQERLRKNINQLKGEKKADTIIKRKFSWFNFGTADWAVSNTKTLKGNSFARADLSLGTILLGGEANAFLTYNNNPLEKNQQYYNWRYVNNDNALIKQVSAGRFFTQTSSSINGSITGIQVTNTPTSYRRTYGTYRLSNKTDPGWMVELYVNGVLINFIKADASGFFTFEVPIIYGNSVIKLRFYSPWGEERTREENISIPFNFIPLKQLEYTLSAGVVDNEEKSKFSRGNLNFGLSRRITIGGGVEFLSSVTSGKTMPFLNASFRLGQYMIVSAEHLYGVRSKALLSYKLPANMQFDLTYALYDKTQTAINFNFHEERKAVLSVPIRAKKFTGFSRLTLQQFKIFKTTNTFAELLFSSVFAGISTNLTTFTEITQAGNPLVYSNLSMTFRMPGKIRLTPQALYEYKQNKLTVIRCEAEKSIFNRGFVNISYQKDLLKNVKYTSIGVRYNFSFAQTAVFAQHSKHQTVLTQSARGSLIYNDKSQDLGFNQQNNVGKGGVVILPFLDLNFNGKKDAHEPRAAGLNMRINGGRMESNRTDTNIHVTGLDPYTNYFIEFDKNSFENIAWQLKHKSLSINIEPNHFTYIEVPIYVMGEVSGVINLDNGKSVNGQGRVIINIYDAKDKLAGRTISETDGYFNFLGLPPGVYTLMVDEAQLTKLTMTSIPGKLSFSIVESKDGDVVEGLQILLKNNVQEKQEL